MYDEIKKVIYDGYKCRVMLVHWNLDGTMTEPGREFSFRFSASCLHLQSHTSCSMLNSVVCTDEQDPVHMVVELPFLFCSAWHLR